MRLKKKITDFFWRISPTLSCTISYVHNRRRFPNFRNPKDISEIVFSQIISGENKKFAPYVDKVKVRDYIEDWGLGAYLPKLYGVWDRAEDIDFDSLPNKFALKCNNLCGGHLFCHDKNSFDIAYAKSHMNMELSKASRVTRESQYNEIIPKIYAEELLEDPEHVQPVDYKFMCCDGRVNGCLIAVDRGTEDGVHFTFYDNNWNQLDDFIQGHEKAYVEIPKPKDLDKMIVISKKIAQKFMQVRVDLYNLNGKIYIGELTFTPQGGMLSYFTNKAIDYLGHRDSIF